MSTLATLKDQVKRYFDANTTLYNTTQGQPENAAKLEDQIEMAIVHAANNARRFAELRHDFAVNDVVGRATLSAGEPLWLDEVTLGSSHEGQVVSLKSIRMVHLVDTNANSLTPIKVVKRQTEAIAVQKRLQNQMMDRYPGDPTDFETSQMYAIVNGRYLTVQPFSDTSVINIAVDGNRWSNDYVHDDDSDFFLKRGFEFMQWQCIIELNHMLMKFIPRQEGSLAPPTQARDIAFENLLLADSYSVDGAIWHDL